MTGRSTVSRKKQKKSLSQNSAHEKEPFNYRKDLWMPVIGTILGFSIGVTQDIIKHEYEYRMQTPKLRFSETASSPVQVNGIWSQEITTRLRCVGHAQIPAMIVGAEPSDPENILIGMTPSGQPDFSPPDVVGIPQNDQPQLSIKMLRINNFHDPQIVYWKVIAKSPRPFVKKPVHFTYQGIGSPINDLEDEQRVSLKERISTLPLTIILFIYSITTTFILFFVYLARKRDQGERS
jgi:hypothetical protein